MKALLPILILGIVILGVVYFSKNKSTNTENTTNSIPELAGEKPAKDLTGTFAFEKETALVKWTGSKKIIVDYFDTGTINIKSGLVNMENGEVKSGEIIFDMTSIAAVTTGGGSGQDGLTKHLKSADFFEVETYPEAKYVVTSSEKTKDGVVLKGDLTLKGQTNPLDVLANVKTENGNVLIAGIAEIDRSKWNVRFGSESFFDNLGDNVINDIFKLEFTLTARP
jgi:polyisoprenoid-binding protein YceI